MPSNRFQFNGAALALDARPDRLDFRDRTYAPRVCNLPPSFPEFSHFKRMLSAYVKAGLVLNQGSEGACTGFGLAAVINYLMWHRNPDIQQASPRMLYHLAQFYDEWAGEDYVGSSCRGALKGWHKHGVCSRELWPYTVRKNNSVPVFEKPKKNWAEDAATRPLGTYYRINKASVTDMQAAILEIGAIYVSGKVHEGWQFDTSAPKKRSTLSNYDNLPVITWHPETSGGHAFALIGYTDQGFIVQNSWGTGWGHQGFAVLTYEDWVANGSDAWTVSLGVPVQRGAIAAQHRPYHACNLQHPGLEHISVAPAYRASGSLLDVARTDTSHRAGLPKLTTDQAYGFTVIMGNDGGVIQRIVEASDAVAAVDHVVLEAPLYWLQHQPTSTVLRLAVYAHGGLNSEEDSLRRIAAMAPYFLANGIYPVFITWRTGLQETLIDMLADKINASFPEQERTWNALTPLKNAAAEVADRTVESLAENLGGKGQWIQMKQNAEQGAEDGTPARGLFILADRLAQLQKTLGKKKLELHLIGHSAGSIVQGHLLRLLGTRQLAVASCSLYAPACTLAFANQTYRPAIESNQLPRDKFHLHMMSDAREQEDNVAGIYHKSLLYLVARAFETQHKTPLLGMAASLDAATYRHIDTNDGMWNPATINTLNDWNTFYWNGHAPQGFSATGTGLNPDQASRLHIVNDKTMNCGTRHIPTAHGAFDNDVATISATLSRILGLPSSDALPQPVIDLDY
ncbi:C1 family peptidase [Undibacterium sp. SXout7W]|uniref:C1 family peptidase n=1 Tax=Undibacterium sp. SXout7W TaxID=3413049 RepID=UPI003BF1FDAE